MRTLFFVLVLANLVFFAWRAGYLAPLTEHIGEGERMSQQVAPDSIRIITADEARRLTNAPPSYACLEWGNFPAQELERVLVLLAVINPAPKFSQRKVDDSAGWWVYVPAQPNKAAADKKVGELRELRVSEFFVISEDGPNKYAISLGVFKTGEAARNYLETLTRRGVKTARADERETKLTRTVLQFPEVDDGLKARLAEIKKDFNGIDLRDCPLEERKAGDLRLEEKKG